MKKIGIYVVFLSFLSFLCVDKVNAECDNRTQLEINTASSSVSMNYDMETLVIDKNNKVHPELSPNDIEYSEVSEYTTIDQVTVNIQNVTDKIYVVFENEDDGIYKLYHYQDLENGGLKYVVPNNDIIRKFKLTIYSNATGCSDQELRTIEVTTPKYNEISTYPLCENNNNYYCKTYVTSDLNLDVEKLSKDYVNNQENNPSGNNVTEINSNKKNYLIGIMVVIILIAVIVYLLINRKNFKDLGGM